MLRQRLNNDCSWPHLRIFLITIIFTCSYNIQATSLVSAYTPIIPSRISSSSDCLCNFVSSSLKPMHRERQNLLKTFKLERWREWWRCNHNLSLYHHLNNHKDDIAMMSDNNKKIIPPSLTVILPAFNEEDRIGKTIQMYCSFLMNHPMDQYFKKCHMLIVDDGSTDNTRGVVQSLAPIGIRKNHDDKYKSHSNSRHQKNHGSYNNDDDRNIQISCISLQQNEGKGSAISRGIKEVLDLQSRSKGIEQKKNRSDNNFNCTDCKNYNSDIHEESIILIADADGSGDIQSLEKMVIELWKLVCSVHSSSTPSSSLSSAPPCIWNNAAIVVGNRGYDGTSMSRGITRWGFRTAVKLLCGDLRVNDTQCGFKLMTLKAGCILYSNLNLKRWTNDVEVLYRAKLLGVSVSEIMIGWRDKDGSKLASTVWGTVRISFVMLIEILYMRLQYLLGRWC